MSKPLTKEQIQLKKSRRLKDKNIKNLLLHRFLHHYGYDKGEITAKAIIDDILKLIEEYFLVSSIDDDLHHVHYGQLVYMAVDVEGYPRRGQSIADTKLRPVVLSLVADDDQNVYAHGFDFTTLRKNRIKRWCDQAFDQGGLLSQIDLSMLLGVCDATISKYVNAIQSSGHLLPTRGNIHDLSGAVTHKREIITLYLENYMTPEIATKTKHSREAVDRYIQDYHRVEMLWRHGITDLVQISQLARLSKRVAQQYIDLLPDKVKYPKNKKLDSDHLTDKLNPSGQTEAGSAEEQPVKG